MSFRNNVKIWIEDEAKLESMAAKAGVTAADLKNEWQVYLALEDAKDAGDKDKESELMTELIAIQRR